MDIFQFDDYKQLIRARTTQLKGDLGQRYTLEKVANACGVQKTYFSKVLNTDADLSADQLFSVCEFLKLTSQETEYVLLLREMNASRHHKRQELLKKKLAEIQRLQQKTEGRLTTSNLTLDEASKWEFYTDGNIQLIHMFLNLETYSKSPNLICKHLGVSEEELQVSIQKLRQLGLVKYEGKRLVAPDINLHLSADSSISHAHRILQRIKTLEYMNSRRDSNSYHFSALFTSNSKTYQKIRRLLLDTVSQTHKEVVQSKSEAVFQMNMDLFSWTRDVE